MKLFTFSLRKHSFLGLEVGNKILNLTSAEIAYNNLNRSRNQYLLKNMLTFVRNSSKATDLTQKILELGVNGLLFDFQDISLQPPLFNPGKILCAGINYKSHTRENPEATIPKTPYFFAKLPSVIIGPFEKIIKPKLTQQLDYEVELAVIIGKEMKNVSEDKVIEKIFGYSIMNDVSARDIQFDEGQLTLAKNFDTFAPLGPCIVTKDESPNIGDIKLKTFVNNKLMQTGSTSDWVFSLPELISYLSQVMTLYPGDIVSTGTPAGVGYFRKPQFFLKKGDKITMEIEKIGKLENSVA